MSDKRFSDFVIGVLRTSGWFPGRNIGDLLLTWRRELSDSDGFEMFPQAEAALSEFGGLIVNQSGAGVTCAREPFSLIPTLAIYEGDRFAEFSDSLGMKLYPLGEVSSGNYFLSMGEDGRVFLIMQDIQMLGENIERALESLIIGN